ncbi:MAG: hypothetical protein IKS48_07100 [Eubacterium sp.]|nr:hypothetical protein [Eubacterium sp.]
MNLFELFVNLTHNRFSPGWENSTATFTGKTDMAYSYTKLGSQVKEYKRYEVVYNANDKQVNSWYTFFPVPDPDPETLIGTTMKIRYKRSRPYLFEQIEDSEDL